MFSGKTVQNRPRWKSQVKENNQADFKTESDTDTSKESSDSDKDVDDSDNYIPEEDDQDSDNNLSSKKNGDKIKNEDTV